MAKITLPNGEQLDLNDADAVRTYALRQIASAAAGCAPGMNAGSVVQAAKELLAHADSLPDRQASVFRAKPDSDNVQSLDEERERLRQAKIAERRGK